MERLVSRFRRHAALAGLLVLAAATATVAGCGASGGDVANGKSKFAVCGGCHTLADAGTHGLVGPNLDDAFRASRRQGIKPSTFEGVIRYWIEKPQQRTPPLMTPNLVRGKDADDVAAYVASVAGTDPESPARPEQPTQ
jgi:mono/diheme cytochrome c family protein